jgi:hypothetical protein
MKHEEARHCLDEHEEDQLGEGNLRQVPRVSSFARIEAGRYTGRADISNGGLMTLRDRPDADEIRIANTATYWPVAPTDVVLAVPLAARLLLGATPVGRVVQAAAFGAYFGCVLQDWYARLGVRKIDFLPEFGADVYHLTPMPREAREEEVRLLTERLNDEFTPERVERRELAVEVDRHLTRYIASITGQQVQTSAEVRDFSIARLIFPFALGACDFLTGDVMLFRDVGVFEPHVIAHEFSHRKGYWKELEAQALAYLALTASGEPALVQSALCERLHRNLRAMVGDDRPAFRDRVAQLSLRPELRAPFLELERGSPAGLVDRPLEVVMRRLYDERMRLTGQNGLSDYDVGFTNFLYTFELSSTARQEPPAAGALRPRAVLSGTAGPG